MKCEQVQSLLVSYLNNETTPSERAMMQAHLSGCKDCEEELSRISDMQGQLSSTLQRRAAQAEPSAAAWEHLQARLVQDAQPAPVSGTWLSRFAQDVNRVSSQLFSGDVTMRKRLTLSALMAVLVISIVSVYMAKTVTRVSAKEILNQAYAAQSANVPTQGIQHIRSENYFNLDGLAADQGAQTILDSYADLQNGNFRVVTIDSKIGKVLDASAYDGANRYSRDYSEQTTGADSLTIYRTPQGQVAELKPGGNSVGPDERAMFEQMRNDPNVKFAGEETWDDERKVYVLQSQQPMKAMVKDGEERPLGLVTIYFDASTYKQIGYRMTMEKDGQQILLGFQKILADEILPAGTSVAWDLSDLQGITIVDDLERIHGDLLPEVISEQELAIQTRSAYLLKIIPEGYSLEISKPQIKPGSSEPYLYIATYRNPADDYFVIQAAPGQKATAMNTGETNPTANELVLGVVQEMGSNPPGNETYTTTSGLVLHFEEAFADPAGKLYILALVEAPGGVTFMVSSTLPRETVEAWAEELVVVK